jgi:hypothetical protein
MVKNQHAFPPNPEQIFFPSHNFLIDNKLSITICHWTYYVTIVMDMVPYDTLQCLMSLYNSIWDEDAISKAIMRNRKIPHRSTIETVEDVKKEIYCSFQLLCQQLLDSSFAMHTMQFLLYFFFSTWRTDNRTTYIWVLIFSKLKTVERKTSMRRSDDEPRTEKQFVRFTYYKYFQSNFSHFFLGLITPKLVLNSGFRK